MENCCTHTKLHRGLNRVLLDPEWIGSSDESAGAFTVGDRYVIYFRELRITLISESPWGPDKPLLSMRYHAIRANGKAWEESSSDPEAIPHRHWRYEGRDDQGTEYEFQQGASGFPLSDRIIFDSDVIFEPDMPVNVRWVEVRFFGDRDTDRPAHTFRADLPPRSLEALSEGN